MPRHPLTRLLNTSPHARTPSAGPKAEPPKRSDSGVEHSVEGQAGACVAGCADASDDE
jgi:hypothetical protein